MITYEHAQQALTKWRHKLLIPPNWQIDLLVLPADEMEGTLGRCSWGHIPNAEYRIRVRQDLTPEELDCTMAHELLEALMASYAGFVEEHVFAKQLGNKGLLRYLVKQHAEIRDTIIEHMLCVLIGQKRPMRIY